MALIGKSVNETFELLRPKLVKLMPEFEIRLKAELVYEINRLKKERNAIILGHNYMEPALYHGVTDVVGDSLELSRQAQKTEKDPIIFCGVRFMGETAKILNPGKTVLVPSPRAGCSLAESISADDVRRLRSRYPGVPVIAYINTYADVKAEIDVCCTSGNAKRVVESFKGQPIIFLPDRFLAANVAQETGRKLIFAHDQEGIPGPDTLIAWNGRCEVHEKFTVEDVAAVRRQFPNICVLAHPECPPEVVAAADYSGSTSAMIGFLKESKAPEHLLLTECSMADNLIGENPDKEIVRLCSLRCPHMAEITLEETLSSLRNNCYQIEVPEPIRNRALKSLLRMLEL